MKQIFLVLMAPLIVSCRTIIPVQPVYDLEQAVESLQDSQEESAIQVREMIKASEGLEARVPDDVRSEVAKLTETIKTLEKHMEKEREITAEVSSEVLEVEKTVTILHEEKVQAEVESAKVKGQRNSAWIILGGIAFAAAVWVFVRLKAGIIGVIRKIFLF